MYNFNFCSSLFNRVIALLVTISLLSVSFSFNFDKNIKKEFNVLYEATSVCEYYNTLTNFSYGIINKILESTNIVLTEANSQKSNTEKKEKEENNEQNNLYFVKSNNEKEITTSKKFNIYNLNFSKVFFNSNTGFNFQLNKFVYQIYIFKLTCITLLLCYFARDNIEDININNIIKKVRLV